MLINLASNSTLETLQQAEKSKVKSKNVFIKDARANPVM